MTFVLVNALFLGVALAVALVAHRRVPPAAGSRRVAPFVVAFLAMAALTTVFDNLMIAADLFDYGREHRLGILVGQAPIEDYAYPLGALVLLPAVWRLLTADRPGRDER
ncbi:lycopene cyclase domain-containing protein [Janibacter sp. YIM B02568]|uniref:lycopene cyclase domain-containing protein n=1 Tax=Janibacter endophyticus TaxID=2806261 RepID=UPI00194E96CD|nr:lycopene cyclase domain-containing protein [Janibacter endophyticus]MBM6545046.1 lycopene cyclase domain-containing protein [Janibacter endophyticus]